MKTTNPKKGKLPKDVTDLRDKVGRGKLAATVKANLRSVHSATQKSKTSGQTAVMASLPDGVEVHYDVARKEYLLLDARGRWIALNEGQFKRECKLWGISTRAAEDCLASPFDRCASDLQRNRGVDYVGPLAGFLAGLHEESGRRLLVTSGPVLVEPVRRRWPTLAKVLVNVLGDEAEGQQFYFHARNLVTQRALRAGRRQPGQAVVYVGPAECGKSLLQDLETVLLGGREAKPYRYMTGQSNFNGDLAGAEHLRIGDDAPHTDLRARRHFGAQIKQIVAEPLQRIEAKYYEAMDLRPFWRLSIALNDEPENLLVLPPLDEHTRDKLIIFKAYKRPMPMPTATVEERATFWAVLLHELPGYLHWLLNKFVIPAELISQRFGVRHFHHPEITAELEGFEPHREFLTLVDRALFGPGASHPGGSWEGTAEELEELLTRDGSSTARAARKLLDWRGATGRFLGRLAREAAARVEENRRANRRAWIVAPPPNP